MDCNLCSDCDGVCCQGIIEVLKEDEIFNDNLLTRSGYSCGINGRVMKWAGDTTKCIALVNGKCSIHEKRPTVCREFEAGSKRCLNYRKGYLNSGKHDELVKLNELL